MLDVQQCLVTSAEMLEHMKDQMALRHKQSLTTIQNLKDELKAAQENKRLTQEQIRIKENISSEGQQVPSQENQRLRELLKQKEQDMDELKENDDRLIENLQQNIASTGQEYQKFLIVHRKLQEHVDKTMNSDEMALLKNQALIYKYDFEKERQEKETALEALQLTKNELKQKNEELQMIQMRENRPIVNAARALCPICDKICENLEALQTHAANCGM